MIFNDFSSLFHTLVIGGLAYIAVIVILRVSGKRTLSKWNSFDFVVTIAFGSTLATVLLSQDTSLIQGVFGFGLLTLLQYIFTWLSVRSTFVQKLIKAQPTLLVANGTFQTSALARERVTESEIRAAVRSKGIANIEDVDAVVLETDGSFSVLHTVNHRSDSAMADVQGYTALVH